MNEQQTLVADKPVIDLTFIDTLKMREAEIEDWNDCDKALGELFYVRTKLADANQLKTKHIERVLESFEKPIERLEAIRNLIEGKVRTFAKHNNDPATGFVRKEDQETGKVTLSKTLQHGEITIVVKEEIKLKAVE